MTTTEKKTWFSLTLIILFLMAHVIAEKQKRQIFREQVTPALGGKIPDEAFKRDRIILNKLNKDGITVPDGMIFTARNVHKHTEHTQRKLEVVKVHHVQDERYIPSRERFRYNNARPVDTTYIIRPPFSHFTANKHSNNRIRNGYHDFSKLQTFTTTRQFTPILPPTKPGIYKSIATPLIFSPNTNLLQETYIQPWEIHDGWSTIYQPIDYIADNLEFINSRQIFHNCFGWPKSPSFCSSSTMFNEVKKQCDWWNRVHCN